MEHLQRSAGNRAVGAVLARAPGRGRRRRRTPRDAALPPLFVDGDGFLSTGGKRVGHVDGRNGYLCIGKTGAPAVPFADADIGTVEPGGSILAVSEVAVEPTGPEQPPTEPGGVAVRPVKATLSGPRLGVAFDYSNGTFHDRLLTRGSAWSPIAFDKLTADRQAKLREVPQAHLELSDGGFWSLMTFHLRDERADKTRWVKAKAEWKTREKQVEADAGTLPANLKDEVDRYLAIIASVMAHEGTYTSKSPGTDPMASVGIFQWGMEKNKPSGAGSSLGMFFLNLKHRAETAQALPPPIPKDQQLFVDAWAQVTDRGVDVREDGRVTVNGSLATGAQIESMMAGSSGEMGQGALKQYQLVAAMDWIEAFKATVVRPGPVGAAKVGHGYRERGGSPEGTKASLTQKKGSVTYTFALDAPDIHATLGDLFSAQKNVGLAVVLGVNRPHYVETALWRALDPGTDPKAQATVLIGRIVAAAEAAAPAAPRGRRSRGRRTVAVTAAKAATWNVGDDYEALRKLIWPMPRELDDAAEEALAAEFEKQSLQLYKPGDARKFHREERFATVDAAFQ